MNGREPFHEGEVAVQERTGERGDAVRRSAMIGASLTPVVRDFLSRQRAIAIAAVDDLGRPWASLRLGAPGFVTCPSAAVLRVTLPHVDPGDDPLDTLMNEGREIGTLAIDFASRGRVRVNGAITEASDAFIDVRVQEVFPNCKKYVQQRVESRETRATLESRGPVARGDRLDGRRQAVLNSVDTIFVASRHHARGVDVSHRGGAPGFVRVLDDRTLRFPDYPGNGMFQTLGNFDVDPRGGVVAVDFERGRLLSLTGRVAMTFGADDPAHPSGGTGRYWDLAVTEWVDIPLPAAADFRMIEASPNNPAPFCAVY